MKTFEIYKNSTKQGELKADSLQEAEETVFATYGEEREVVEVEGYFIEFNGEHYQSVFPSNEAENSSLHPNLKEAISYMVDECGIDLSVIKTENYDTELLEHAVLNQLQADFGDSDFDAYSEMMQLLLKNKVNQEILFQYLSDTAQENLKEGETHKRY